MMEQTAHIHRWAWDPLQGSADPAAVLAPSGELTAVGAALRALEDGQAADEAEACGVGWVPPVWTLGHPGDSCDHACEARGERCHFSGNDTITSDSIEWWSSTASTLGVSCGNFHPATQHSGAAPYIAVLDGPHGVCYYRNKPEVL